MTVNPRRALIIGGGVAGPVLALFLKRSGFDAQVFEASSGPADTGGTLGLAANGMSPLANCTPESLARELLANAAAWDIPSLAPKLTTRPILIIASDDGTGPSSEALAANLTKLGDTQVKSVHITTDHSYSDHRLALEKTVLDGLTQLNAK